MDTQYHHHKFDDMLQVIKLTIIGLKWLVLSLACADIATRESCTSDTIIHLPNNDVFSVVPVFDTSLKILKRAIVDASCGSRRSWSGSWHRIA